MRPNLDKCVTTSEQLLKIPCKFTVLKSGHTKTERHIKEVRRDVLDDRIILQPRYILFCKIHMRF